MTPDDKLRAIRDAVQHDAGNRGLGRDPSANLFNACPDDLAAACRSIAEHPSPVVGIVTGFWIPSARLGETDGPLGAVYLMRTLGVMGIPTWVLTDPFCAHSLHAGLRAAGVSQGPSSVRVPCAMTTVFGSATPCRRAARLGVSPTIPLASVSPDPIM